MTPQFRVERFRWWHIDDVMPIEEDLFGPEQWSECDVLERAGQRPLLPGRARRRRLDRRIRRARRHRARRGVGAATSRCAATSQRRGLGRALLDVLLAEAARQRVPQGAAGGRRRQRSRRRSSTPAYGLRAVAVRRGYYQPSNTDALVMTREDAP